MKLPDFGSEASYDLPCAFFRVRADGIFLGCNGRFASLAKTEPVRVEGNDVTVFLKVPGGSFEQEVSREVERNGSVEGVPLVLRRCDESCAELVLTATCRQEAGQVVADCVVIPIRGESGEKTLVTALAGWRSAEAELRNSEEQLRVLMTVLQHVVWACSPAGNCIFQAPQWEVITGQPTAESLGNGRIQAIHPDDRERAGMLWKSAVEQVHSYQTEYRIRTVCGEYRWFLIRAEPVRDAGGKVLRWTGTGTDIEHSE